MLHYGMKSDGPVVCMVPDPCANSRTFSAISRAIFPLNNIFRHERMTASKLCLWRLGLTLHQCAFPSGLGPGLHTGSAPPPILRFSPDCIGLIVGMALWAMGFVHLPTAGRFARQATSDVHLAGHRQDGQDLRSSAAGINGPAP